MEKDYTFINDIDKPDTVKKGTILASQYSLILEFDKNMNLTRILPVLDDDIENTKGSKILAGVDYGFHIDNSDVLYSFITPYSTEVKEEELDYCVGKFILNEDSCFVLSSFSHFPYPDEFLLRGDFSGIIKFKEINSSLLYSFATYDYFLVDSNEHYIDALRDKSTLKKENIPDDYAFDDDIYFNYNIMEISKDIYSNKIMVFYRADNQFCIEVFDSNYNSLGYTVLNNMSEFPNPESLMELIGFSLRDNILSFNYRERGKIYLMRYKININ